MKVYFLNSYSSLHLNHLGLVGMNLLCGASKKKNYILTGISLKRYDTEAHQNRQVLIDAAH